MDILSKHKKRGEEGFKKFTAFLESTAPRKRRDILIQAKMEDPVYVIWIEKNMLSFQNILEMDLDALNTLVESLPNFTKILLCAFHNTSHESKMLETLLDYNRKAYNDEKEFFKGAEQREQVIGRLRLIEKSRELYNNRSLAGFGWQIPGLKILTGENGPRIISGEFVLRYENGCKALMGSLQDKLRTGFWRHYYPDEGIFAEGSYTAGEKTGKWMILHPNGDIWAEGEYEEDLRSGVWDEYEDNGTLHKVTYKRGKALP